MAGLTNLETIEPDIEWVHVGGVLSEIGGIDFSGEIPSVLDDFGRIFDARELVAFLFGYGANVVSLVYLNQYLFIF